MKNVLLSVSIILSVSLLACSNSSQPKEPENLGLRVVYSNGEDKVEKVILHGWDAECTDTDNNLYQGECLAVESSPVDWAWGNFSANWSGEIYIPAAGEYTFSTWVDGIVYIVVNDSVVSDFNTVGSYYTRTLSFGEAKWYPISMTFTDNGGSNYMHLAWAKPDQVYETVPAANLRHD